MTFDIHPQARIWNSEFDAARGAGNLVVGLLVDKRQDVDLPYHRIKNAGHPVGQESYDAFWGSRFAIVIDPDGNQVGIKSPIDHHTSSEPTTIPPRSPDPEW